MVTYTLTSTKPQQTDAGASGMAYTLGTDVTIFETEADGWGYCFHGVGWNGNAWESDDMTGFDSERAALAAALEEWLEQGEGALTADEIAQWSEGEEPARLSVLRQYIGFSHYHISAKWPGSVQVYW